MEALVVSVPWRIPDGTITTTSVEGGVIRSCLNMSRPVVNRVANPSKPQTEASSLIKAILVGARLEAAEARDELMKTNVESGSNHSHCKVAELSVRIALVALPLLVRSAGPPLGTLTVMLSLSRQCLGAGKCGVRARNERGSELRTLTKELGEHYLDIPSNSVTDITSTPT